ncbi:MAG: hypothetical protein AAF492_16310 [Verrucomicrobiota bacterium]
MAEKLLKKGVKFVFVGCLGLILLTAIGFGLVVWAFSRMMKNEMAGPPEDHVNKVTEPVGLAEVKKDLSFPFPPGASNIYWAEYAQWVAYDFRVRFEAPLEQCRSNALTVLKDFNRKNAHRPVDVTLTRLTNRIDYTEPGPPLNIDWFDLHNITNGVRSARGGSHQPTIWIDEDRQIFYYLYMY